MIGYFKNIKKALLALALHPLSSITALSRGEKHARKKRGPVLLDPSIRGPSSMGPADTAVRLTAHISMATQLHLSTWHRI